MQALGPDIVTFGDDLEGRNFADRSKMPAGRPAALIEPRTTAEVSATLALCHAHGQSVVVQGGLTGLAGAGTALGGEVAIHLGRMRAIEEVDPTSATMTVQAGVVLAQVQEAASQVDLCFPLDLGARGSCTIGGAIATNAGGNRVIKYGMMRESVLGIEAVLADGRIITDMRKMLKNNTGYDLKSLILGSEGTLAVVTRAVLRLRPEPRGVSTAFCGLSDYHAVTMLLRRAQSDLPGGVSAFEVMWPDFYDFVLGANANLRRPLEGRHTFYVLIETDGPQAQAQAVQFESFLETLIGEGVIEDAAIARSSRDATDLWAVREGLGALTAFFPHGKAYDISFAIREIHDAVTRLSAGLAERCPDALTLFYGHLGDGNIHLVINLPGGDPALGEAVDAFVYSVVGDLAGSVSAEHGIGLKRPGVLGYTRSPNEVAAMVAIKAALDPAGILGRGRIFTS